ncbi:hypothetical protein ILUMI_13561 [Ignelater luminosus]|uniref:C-type lectin domain-containing protein n=1 Tax=Ignelater luminosus TaxID=2038154 RepID=A0A8K0CS54_IGNLU|nr:hypothetical protein ILUMI_13561 [Ignelater luminosus]
MTILALISTFIVLLITEIIPQNIKTLKRSEFNVPTYNAEDSADVIGRGGEEFLFVRKNKSQYQAALDCRKSYFAKLVTIDNLELALFLADTLAQSEFRFDNLWTSGKATEPEEEKETEKNELVWFWQGDLEKPHRISDIVLNILKNSSVDFDFVIHRTHCLAFGRKQHSQVLFQDIDCRAKRAYICQRWYGEQTIGNSTHAGWIKLGERLYKIFPDLISWNEGEARCKEHDAESNLAVVTGSQTRELGRLMKISRPSIEMAFVGAKCNETFCTFREGNAKIPIDFTEYKSGEAAEYLPEIRDFSCLAIDQHKTVSTAVQVNCYRKLPYICYKMVRPPFFERTYKDYFFDEYAYRLFLTQATWEQAKLRCEVLVEEYQGRLVEITDKLISKHLLYIMSDNYTTIGHIWIGGQFDIGQEKWIWTHTNKEVDMSVLNWVVNKTYFQDFSDINLCLNMDRENPYVILHYGTACYARQNFVCGYTSQDLRRMQRDEYLGIIPTVY